MKQICMYKNALDLFIWGEIKCRIVCGGKYIERVEG